MTIELPVRDVPLYRETDVLVAGGGPAGLGAAVAAAGNGARTLLLDKRGFLGGNITACYVETCNHFLHNLSFKTSGIWAAMEGKYRAQFGNSGDIRPGSPNRFSSEFLKIFLDDFVGGAGVDLLLHSFVNEVVLKDTSITHVVIQSKKGPLAVSAKQFIDCTGDGDLAFAAGVPFDQGRDTDHRCQPGTLNFRIGGVDAARLTAGGKDLFREIGKRFREDYRAGITGLSCKRQDIPGGRITLAGQLSYINYPCAYGIDPVDIADLTRGETECRRYILEMCAYMKEKFEGFENSELVSIAPEIGFRDSRRIHGEYRLTTDDVLSGRRFDDAIARFPQFYDMLSPDANMNEGSPLDAGNNGYICSQPRTEVRQDRGSPLHPQDGLDFEIPFRSLLPLGAENLLVAGRCISADHVAESGIRAITACMYTGQAAGTAAALAVKKGVTPRTVAVPELQETLRAQGLIL